MRSDIASSPYRQSSLPKGNRHSIRKLTWNSASDILGSRVLLLHMKGRTADVHQNEEAKRTLGIAKCFEGKVHSRHLFTCKAET